MSACPEFEESLTLHAAGALEPEEEARVRAHLEACAGCRAEAEASARVLAEVALPPPSLAERKQLEDLPRQALGAWRREQVRKAFRARTVGALLATAAAVLVVLSLSTRRTGTVQGPVSPSAPAVFAETQADFEQWASANPLGEELAVADEDVEDGEEEEWEVEPSVSELFLNPNLGETP